MTSPQYLAQTLERIQEEMGLTYAEFAAELGVGKSTVYNLRSGLRQFSSATLDQIADSLRLPPAVLLGGGESVTCLCKAVLRTCAAAGRLRETDRQNVLYYLGRLMDLLK